MGVSAALAGSIVLFVLVFAAATLIGMMLFSFVSISSDFLDYYLKTLKSYKNEIHIVNSTITNILSSSPNVTIDIEIEISNVGPDPIWNFNQCDIFILYKDNITGTLQVLHGVYGIDWWVKEIKLTDNYTVSFDQHRIIDSGEIGVIEIIVKAPIDTSYPIKITFVSHYGSRVSKWIDLTG